MQPLSIGLDLSSEIEGVDTELPPLPSQLLGTDPTCLIQCGHTKINSEDQLILLSSGQIAPTLWESSGEIDFNVVAQKMIQQTPEMPFWLGVVQFE